jgi:hypothetical protein
MPDESPKGPEKSFRLGNVSASVFLNQAESGRDFRSVVFQRSYKNDAGERRFSNSFNAADLPVLERVLKLAQEHVEQIEVLIDDATDK